MRENVEAAQIHGQSLHSPVAVVSPFLQTMDGLTADHVIFFSLSPPLGIWVCKWKSLWWRKAVSTAAFVVDLNSAKGQILIPLFLYLFTDVDVSRVSSRCCCCCCCWCALCVASLFPGFSHIIIILRIDIGVSSVCKMLQVRNFYCVMLYHKKCIILHHFLPLLSNS